MIKHAAASAACAAGMTAAEQQEAVLQARDSLHNSSIVCCSIRQHATSVHVATQNKIDADFMTAAEQQGGIACTRDPAYPLSSAVAYAMHATSVHVATQTMKCRFQRVID